MKRLSLPMAWILFAATFGLSFSTSAYSQGLGDVKQLCNNATAANKAMAKQAGYDLDSLCKEVSSKGPSKKAAPPPPKVARPTVATEASGAPEQVAAAAAPVAVAGVASAKPAKNLKPFGYDLFANGSDINRCGSWAVILY